MTSRVASLEGQMASLTGQIPLIASGIFYAANTEYRIDYVDSLFLCMSAMTVTGLATVDLSTLNPFQHSNTLVMSCLPTPKISTTI